MTQTKESDIILAIQAIENNPKISIRRASRIYNIPRSTLTHRMASRRSRQATRANEKKLKEIEKEVLVQYIIDFDPRGYSLPLKEVEDKADLLLRDRNGRCIGTHWAQRFIASHSQLKTCVNRFYDYQRALCEDPAAINAWFELVRHTIAKYGIQDCDPHNFDETGFMMSIASPKIVITRADRHGGAKSIQPGNRQWATAIEYISVDGWCVLPLLIVKGKMHLAHWYTDSGLPDDWAIAIIPNGWTDNQTGLE